MSSPPEQTRRVIPAHLGFLAIYNPSLGTTDETIENQIVYYSTPDSQDRSKQQPEPDRKATADALRQQNNEQLRQIGLAQGMVEFGRSFSDGRAVDTVETEKSRIILHELESGWWILASINLTVLPGTTRTAAGKGKATEQQETIEYSSREVKPAILLLGDLLRAHSTFLLHHASSMSALFVRTRRSKFMGLLGRYWDTFLATWNVLLHGNPANSLYGGIKIAASGELGMGVGEEDRGSGEREVLEGLVGRIDGLVDMIVSKFGEANSNDGDSNAQQKRQRRKEPTEPWLGSGNEPAAEDGVVFLGAGALSRKSLRDVSHWIEDLYRWGPYAYGVIDNPSSNRRTKKSRQKPPTKKPALHPDSKKQSRQVYGLSLRDKRHQQSPLRHDSMSTVPPMPINDTEETTTSAIPKNGRPVVQRGTASFNSSDSDSTKGNKFVQYLKLGYGTHWSLGGTPEKDATPLPQSMDPKPDGTEESSRKSQTESSSLRSEGTFETSYAHIDSAGHYLIGLMGDIENEDDEDSDADGDESKPHSKMDGSNSRLVLRTLTVELEREEDARLETDISIDLGSTGNDLSSKINGSEHTGTSNTSFESQDRNKTKKLRVVVYANKPFLFVFLFELRTDALALAGLYRSLHHQIAPLLKPLLTSTAFRLSKPEVTATDGSTTPIYDLVWDPRLLTINSTIPNIPDPLQPQSQQTEILQWSRIEALNTHMQIINTYISGSTDKAEVERTCKTSRGWWVVWTRVPGLESPTLPPASGQVSIPELIPEDDTTSQKLLSPDRGTSRGTSTFGASMTSGPAHPFLETSNGDEFVSKDKEIVLIRRASDYVASRSGNRFASGSSVAASEASWTSGPGKLAQGIGVDTKRYIEALLNLNR